MITRAKYYKPIDHFWKWLYNPTSIFLGSFTPCLKVKFLSSGRHPSFIIQITTLRLSSACLDELRAFDILYQVFALQAEVIIKTLRKYMGAATNIMTEAAGSLYGMYYWAKVPRVRCLFPYFLTLFTQKISLAREIYRVKWPRKSCD